MRFRRTQEIPFDYAEILGAIEDKMAADGIQRTDLAKMLGVSRSSISQMLNPETGNRIHTVIRIFDVLGIDASLRIS